MARKVLALRFMTLLCLGCIVVHLLMQSQTEENSDRYSRELFGVGEPIALRSVWEGLDVSLCLEAIRSIGVASLREWTWMGASLLNETTINPVFEQILDRVILEAKEDNITVLGMSHDFPGWMTGIESDPQAIPFRNTTVGSDYMRFLEIYRRSWQTLAAAFPNITVWEMGNEFNTDIFLHPPQSEQDNMSSSSFSAQEKADITTDLLYYGSLGVHQGNPEAVTVMGGLAPYPSISESAAFLDMIYENIESGKWPSTDPDDYFQILCWHPYVFVEPTVSNWVEPNKIVHGVSERHGDGEKAVIFSELGFRDDMVSSENASRHLLTFFRLAREHLPWLDTIFWFRLVEPDPATTGEVNPPGYGLVHMNGTWKMSGRTYQWLIRVEAAFKYLGTLWNGSALLETLDERAEDCNLTYRETNYLASIVLFRIDRMTDKAKAVEEWLSGYELDRWKLLFGEEPVDVSILEDYRRSSYADKRALWGIYCSCNCDRNLTEAMIVLGWLKARFDGQKIIDPVWLDDACSEPYKLALTTILAHRLRDHEFRDKLTQTLFSLQILNPPMNRSYNCGGFPGTLGKGQEPNDAIPNLETTILVTYALVLSNPLPAKVTPELVLVLVVIATLVIAGVLFLAKRRSRGLFMASSKSSIGLTRKKALFNSPKWCL